MRNCVLIDTLERSLLTRVVVPVITTRSSSRELEAPSTVFAAGGGSVLVPRGAGSAVWAMTGEESRSADAISVAKPGTQDLDSCTRESETNEC